MVLLAKYPQCQEWLLKEVDSFVSAEGQEPMVYTTVTRAIRIVAFALETVRLYSSVPHVRWEIILPQTLRIATAAIRLLSDIKST